MTTNDQILDRLKKLIAVSRENGATDNEAEVAAGIARKLMNEHGITMEEVKRAKNAEDFARESVESGCRKNPKWFTLLASSVATGFDCTVMSTGYFSVDLLGFARDVAVAKYLFGVLVDELPRTAEQRGRDAGYYGTWLRQYKVDFIIAAAQAIQRRLKTERTTVSSETGLIEAKTAAVEQHFDVADAKERIHKHDRTDSSAYAAGYRHGRSINLSTNTLGDSEELPALTHNAS